MAVKNIGIIIEGLDCSGKETLSKAIFEKIEALSNIKKFNRMNVIATSFPNYDSEYGKRIKSILNSNEEINFEELIDLFRNDRKELFDMYKNVQKCYANNKDDIIVVFVIDRLFFSNLICNLHNEETKEYLLESSNIELGYFNNFFYKMIGVVTKYSTDANNRLPNKKELDMHKIFLSSRKSLDRNETIEKQIQFNSNIDNFPKEFDILDKVSIGYDINKKANHITKQVKKILNDII